MNIRQLEYFMRTAELGSVTSAAKELHVAQPPVSRQLALLEEELGAPLFVRSNRGMVLTDAGRALYKRGKSLFADLEDMKELVQEVDGGLRGHIRIGCVTCHLAVIHQKMVQMQKDYPLVTFYIEQGSSEELLSQLLKEQLDVIFLFASELGRNDLNSMFLEPDTLVAVMPKSMDPAPDSDSIRLDQVKDLPHCMIKASKCYDYSELYIDRCISDFGFRPNVICYNNDVQTNLLMVHLNMGVSLLPMSLIELCGYKNVTWKRLLDFEINCMMPVVVWKKQVTQSRAIELFLSLLRGEGTGEKPRAVQ